MRLIKSYFTLITLITRQNEKKKYCQYNEQIKNT